MKTVGNILRESRLSKHLTLDQVEAHTKIRKKFLESIERDDYTSLPSVSYAKGFVKNYSEYLGLSSSTVLAFFRRQTHEAPRSSLLPNKTQEALRQSFFRLTPGRFLAILLSVLLLSFLGYFVLQYQTIKAPPLLTIDSPKDKIMTQERRVEVLGKTDPDATVYINGASVLVRDDGRFFDQISVEPGVNKVTITATSRFGKTTTIVREVAVQVQ